MGHFLKKFSRVKVCVGKISMGGNDVTFISVVLTFPRKKFYKGPSCNNLNFYDPIKIT
jgi:hypothetical protein